VFSKGMNTKDAEPSSSQAFEIVTNIDIISVVMKYIVPMIYNKVMVFLFLLFLLKIRNHFPYYFLLLILVQIYSKKVENTRFLSIINYL
jgi:hypothetical protein